MANQRIVETVHAILREDSIVRKHCTGQRENTIATHFCIESMEVRNGM